MDYSISAFFSKLDHLEKKDRIRLKKAAGKMLNEADAETMTTFYRLLPPNVKQIDENRWFLTACLHCLEEPNVTDRRSLPTQLCNKINKEKDYDTGTHPAEKLMNMNWDENGYFAQKLLRLVRLLSSKGFHTDCSKLLIDLLYWNSDKKTSQQNWAKEFANLKK